ncbi:hypothetical protein L5D93_30375 [Paenibacillus thiaminolyticus]|nr:hypothetical protein [Paenibacillus thiaminolyticus]
MKVDKRTSIPHRDVEMKSSGSGPVVEYQLSPEELERYRAMPAPDGKVKMPVGLRMAGNDEQRRQSKKEETRKRPDCGLTKQDLLEAVAAGESLSSIERAWKMKNQTLQYWVKKWDLKGITPGRPGSCLRRWKTGHLPHWWRSRKQIRWIRSSRLKGSAVLEAAV